MDDFFWKILKTGEVISDPKNFVAKFLALETPIWGGHFRSKKFRRKKSQHFSQKRGERGGSKAVWNFSKNSSILVQTGFPYWCTRSLTWSQRPIEPLKFVFCARLTPYQHFFLGTFHIVTCDWGVSECHIRIQRQRVILDPDLSA